MTSTRRLSGCSYNPCWGPSGPRWIPQRRKIVLLPGKGQLWRSGILDGGKLLCPVFHSFGWGEGVYNLSRRDDRGTFCPVFKRDFAPDSSAWQHRNNGQYALSPCEKVRKILEERAWACCISFRYALRILPYLPSRRSSVSSSLISGIR